MGCSGSKQGSIGAYEQCSCSENRKVNICPVHILNCMDNVVEDYKQDDLNNERKIYERKIIAKKRDVIGAIKTTSNVIFSSEEARYWLNHYNEAKHGSSRLIRHLMQVPPDEDEEGGGPEMASLNDTVNFDCT